MLDVEDGPSRKVSRSRKRNSSSAKATPEAEQSKRQRQRELTPQVNTEKQSKTSPDKVSPLKQSDWFANSFSAHGRVDDHQARTRHGNKLTSTPKAIRRRSSKHGRKVSPQSNREPSESNSLDASDLLLAEMDMGHMGSDNSQSELNTEITNQPVCATQKPNVTVQSKTKVTNQLQPTAQTSTTPIQNVTVQSKTSVTNQLQPTAQASTNQIQNVTVQSKTSVTNQLQPAAPASTNQIQVCNSVSSSLISNNKQSKVQNNKDSIHAEDTSLFETNRDTSLCKENLSLSKSVESQYFQKSDTQLELHLPTKFANYKQTQVIIENNLQRCSGRIGTPFNFSSVSCGTQGTDCEKSLDNLSFLKSQSCKNDNVTPLSLSKHPTNSSSCNKQGLCSKQCSENCTSKIKSSNILQSQYLSTQKISGETEICSQLPDSEEWNNDKLVSSTQFHSTQVHKTRNCAASTQLHRGLKANPVPKVASSEVLPVPTQGLFSTQSECTQLPRTQSQPTQLQSSQFEGPGTQITQTGTGNRNYRFTQGQFTQNGTQIQSSVCDRTGLIVDTQSNQNDCDISSDMFVDDDACERMATQNICSNTQSLGEKTDRRQRHRRSSRLNTQETLDDDLDTIQQEMQKRRKTIKSDIGKSQQTFCKAQAISKNATDQKRISMETNKDGIDTHSNRNNNISASINPCKLDVGKGNMTCAQQKESIHINKDAVSIGNEKGGNNAVLGTSGSATPGGAGSLHERLKKRLKENAGQRTPNGPASIVEKLREQVLERVNMEAAKSREETSANDIGPFYGLPTKVKHLFETHRGITSLYDWQDECLKLPAIVERRNLIYSLPTSGGKTLVAEILILQELLCRKSDALLILPFVSIVQEKVRNLSQFAVDLDFLVEEYAGSKGRFPPTKRRKNNTLYVATMEKAHSIVNSLIEHGRMDCLGLVVVDELHMIGEGGSRGATLESTLMKILHSSASCQIIGMSATLNNIEDLKQFLNADVYTNDFRPVQLTEYIKLSENIYSVDNEAKCPDDQILHSRIVCFQYKPEMEKTDPDHLFGLVLEVVPDNSCLVFCPTKKNCENVAMMLAKMMVRYKRELSNVKKTERKDLLKQLYNDAEGKICPILQYTLHFGIAYHHSGLTMDERKLIEEAYSDGTLCLLACTSTLAAGVNLPAKRVILRGPYVGQEFISRSQYKQMVGRAGRAGIDTSGESILICKSTDRKRVCDLMAGPLESCQSSLVYNDGKGVRNLILSTIGLKVTTTTNDVFQFVNRSLVQVQQQALNIDILDMCKISLQTLIDLDLVKQVCDPAVDPELYQLEVTSLGKATFKGPVDPDNAGRLYRDLRRAEDPLVVSNHLHLLYLVTPYDMVRDLTPSWFIYFQQMNSLDAAELKVASLIGVPESYIAKRASQQKCKQKVDDLTVNRFYLTLMLYDLWKQKLIWDVAEKFQQQRGFIQNLLSSAASFASCVNHFCQELEEFWAYQALLGDFVKRLSYCVTAELIPLMEIPGVKLGRARLMYKAGYRTLGAVANTDAEILVKAIQHLPRKVAKQIVASAKLLLNEKADAMMEEVEELVSIPQGFAVTMATTDVLDSTVMSTPEMSQNSAATSQTSQQ